MATSVHFWFDPICPWTWISSRWLLEAAKVRDLKVEFHVMSLAILNGADTSEPAWRPVRLVTAAQHEAGQRTVEPLYTALGTRIHDRAETDWNDIMSAALEEVHLPAELAQAAGSDRYDSLLSESHRAGSAKVGADVGTPIIAVDQTAFFGPIVSPAPRGEAAGKLWDGVLLVAREPGFYELKRTRDHGPIFT